ncbi:hypothetical protein MIZ03_1029 [Rhodoferax lithotrophicus]|uniref:Uncharacterized protein n=1 Tax=Rhodoferax lithotrophicus TaxID=2798804 RepID=A0ABM7MIT2_9BURK|nr:hypothetical protein MIZ03_1029 [Rhodoferax sp. MIZ03]
MGLWSNCLAVGAVAPNPCDGDQQACALNTRIAQQLPLTSGSFRVTNFSNYSGESIQTCSPISRHSRLNSRCILVGIPSRKR